MIVGLIINRNIENSAKIAEINAISSNISRNEEEGIKLFDEIEDIDRRTRNRNRLEEHFGYSD
jgi:hypothetical protein